MGSNGKLIPLDLMPVGYRFHPTDQELVCYYLDSKILGTKLPFDIIPVVDICMFEPWELPKFSLIESDDKEWFFFCKRDLKYSNGNRANRATKTGYWKITGRDGKIEGRDSNNLIAKKKFLVFYSGRVPSGTKTNWILHEYHSTSSFPTEKNYVLCRLILKVDKKSPGIDSNFQNNNMTFDDLIPEVNNHHQTNEEQLFQAATLQPNSDYQSLYSELEQALVDSSPSNGIHETTNVNVVQQDGVEDMELSDYNEYFNDKASSNTLLNDMNQEEALCMVCILQGAGGGGFSSDTDLEDLQYNRFLGTSNLFNGQGGPRVRREMRMVKESNGNPPSNHIHYEQEGKVYRRDGINCVSLSRKDDENQPRSDDFVAHGSGGRRIRHRIKLQRKGTAQEKMKEGSHCSSNAIGPPQKEKTSTTEYNKDGKIARCKEVVKGLSSLVMVKENCVGLESTSLPPSVYLVNVIVGLFLIVVMFREMLL